MSDAVHKSGFSVVEDFVGHGIGREMHEDPQVPNYVSKSLREADFALEPGLVLAIEPMINGGSKWTRTSKKDHWTVRTEDGQPSVHFEHTVALTAGRYRGSDAFPNRTDPNRDPFWLRCVRIGRPGPPPSANGGNPGRLYLWPSLPLAYNLPIPDRGNLGRSGCRQASARAAVNWRQRGAGRFRIGTVDH